MANKKAEQQIDHLVKRMTNAECDVVGVQEVGGKSKKHAARVLEVLAAAWAERIGEPVSSYVGETNDETIRSGFLLRDSVGVVRAVKSFIDEPIPSLQPLGPVLYFTRVPIALVLDTPGQGPNRRFWILNIHQKSRSFGYRDRSGTGYELLRTEMAKGIRNIVDREQQNEREDTVFLILGDRNAEPTAASSDVLLGRRDLSDYGRGGGCRISKKGVSECVQAKSRRPTYVGLFETRKSLAPEEQSGGTYVFRKQQQLIDEIMIRERNLDLVRRSNGKLSIGIEGQFYKGSDHKLIWAEFRF